MPPLAPRRACPTLCVVWCDPRPVAAALVRIPEVGAPEVFRSWAGGPRPGWVASSSLSHRTLLIDVALSVVADCAPDGSSALGKARERVAGLGMGDGVCFAEAGPCVLAARKGSLDELFAGAEDERIVADQAACLAGLVAGGVLRDGRSAYARLCYCGDHAVLASHIGDKLAVRHFALPMGMAELDAALGRLRGMVDALDVEGFSAQAREWRLPQGFEEVCDRREKSLPEAIIALTGMAVELRAKGLLPQFENQRRFRCFAVRSLPPLCVALAILCVAAFIPLQVAHSWMTQAQARAEEAAERMESFQARTTANTDEVAELSRLRARCGVLLENGARTNSTIGALLALDEVIAQAPSFAVESLAVASCGGSVILRGSVAEADAQTLERLDGLLRDRGYASLDEGTFRRSRGRIEATFTLEALP